MLPLAVCALLACGRMHAQDGASGPAHALVQAMGSVELDPQQVYSIRDAALEIEDLHLTFDDGRIAFTRAVDGTVTGALFAGDGELLVVPPDNAERASLARFIGSAVLEERITMAYLRFDRGVLDELRPALEPADDASAFLARWSRAAVALASVDAQAVAGARLNGGSEASGSDTRPRYFHARLAGAKLGLFDAVLDTRGPEQIIVGQVRESGPATYHDLWMMFPMRSARLAAARRTESDATRQGPVRLEEVAVRGRLAPPSVLEADADLMLDALRPGQRMLLFDLSRELKVRAVELERADGGSEPLEFMQAPASSAAADPRQDDGALAVVLPRALAPGEPARLHVSYAGPVLADAGGGLLHVGARGTWYPNFGLQMTHFDLSFRWPRPWTLLVTGTRVESREERGERFGRWRTERPIPVAGFNLGMFESSTAESGPARIDVYARRGTPDPVAVLTAPARAGFGEPSILIGPKPRPDAAAYLAPMAQHARATVDLMSEMLAPFPFPTLSITQVPGGDSQGWPGLIFLSTHAFTAPALELHGTPDFAHIMYEHLMPAHEIAHQWWGDSVGWATYHDQWLMESLANYSALLELERTHPEQVGTVLRFYRDQLEQPGPTGAPMRDAGPVTLGERLNSSRVPGGYVAVAYGRGTWLLHMLRTLLRSTPSDDAETAEPDARFWAMLRELYRRNVGRAIGTADLQNAAEAALPRSSWYEGRRSLDWFFEGWVNGTAVPRFRLRGVSCRLQLCTGTLLQEDAPEQLVTPLPLYASDGRGMRYAGLVFADGRETQFRLHVPAGTAHLVLDPEHAVLRQE